MADYGGKMCAEKSAIYFAGPLWTRHPKIPCRLLLSAHLSGAHLPPNKCFCREVRTDNQNCCDGLC